MEEDLGGGSRKRLRGEGTGWKKERRKIEDGGEGKKEELRKVRRGKCVERIEEEMRGEVR